MTTKYITKHATELAELHKLPIVFIEHMPAIFKFVVITKYNNTSDIDGYTNIIHAKKQYEKLNKTYTCELCINAKHTK